MARPLVIVFQELAAPQATPTIPDLNTVIVGPAYDLLDYPDDAAAIQLSSTYGLADQPSGGPSPYVPPITGADAVTVLSNGYPSQAAGSIVDHASVKVVLKFPRVILGSTNASVPPMIGTSIKTDALDQTLIELVGSVLDEGFVKAGVQPGDRITLTSSQVSPVQTVTRTVASVGEPNTAGLVASPNAKLLRITQNLPASGVAADQWLYALSGGEIRIERELPIQELIDSTNTIITFPEPGTDKLVIKGGIELDVELTPVGSVADPSPATTTTALTLSYAPLYLSYRALRQDLQSVMSFDSADLVTIAGVPTVNGLGKIDARNPLATGVSVALANSGTAPIYAYGVASDDITGHANAREAMSTRRDLYCFVPLTQVIDIIAGYKTEFDAMADPLQALADGVIQKFRVVIGSVPLPVATTVYAGSISGVAQPPTGANTDKRRTINIDMASTGTDLAVNQVLPGDSVTIGLVSGVPTWENRRGIHKVSHVNSSYVLATTDSDFEVTPGTSRWLDGSVSAAADIEFVIKAPDGTVKASNLAELTITSGLGTVRYAMLNPTLVGGPYTVTYVGGAAALSVVLTGFSIVVNFVTATTQVQDVAAAVSAHPILSTLMSATEGGVVTALIVAAGPTAINPLAGSCTATVNPNDDLFNRLEDADAQFISAGVKAGDTIEIPIDPNDYSPTAYDGRVLSYTVSSVISENRLLIANGVDDTSDAAKELPHYYARDLPDRFIDNTATNAQNYRVRRRLSKDDQILALTTTAQSVRSKRCTLSWPDVVQVTDLRNGALPRASASTRTLAGDVEGFYVGCQVGGASAGLPAQHGLTNLGLSGINDLKHAQIYFSERQLTRLSDGGFFVMIQQTPGALPICIHQLTTDPTALETGEFSVVKNVDFVAKFFLDLLEPFIGVYNVTAATQNEILRAVTDGSDNLKGRTLDRIGPPLISGSVTDIHVSEFDASRIEIYFRGVIPKPLNTIAFHLVV